MRYLLDELMTYEEGFTDILMGDRASDRHETFMGECSSQRVSEQHDLSEFIRRDDLQAFQQDLVQSLTTLFTPQHIHQSSSGSSYPSPISHCMYYNIFLYTCLNIIL